MPHIPQCDTGMWALIQPIIADGWIARSLIEDRILAVLEIEDDAQAEEVRARVHRVLDAREAMGA
ncbi:hypothetical protein [Falsirhodobacter sp. 1013]|uniref:hypothetical protein n=1 Tax=Falsirhodobacter sp. 1013 TaxID=3417566 RepID=UPI003EB8E347